MGHFVVDSLIRWILAILLKAHLILAVSPHLCRQILGTLEVRTAEWEWLSWKDNVLTQTRSKEEILLGRNKSKTREPPATRLKIKDGFIFGQWE